MWGSILKCVSPFWRAKFHCRLDPFSRGGSDTDAAPGSVRSVSEEGVAAALLHTKHYHYTPDDYAPTTTTTRRREIDREQSIP